MPSKLGPHFIGTPGYQRWEAAGVQVMKFDPSSVGASEQVPPGILVVGKLDQQEEKLKLTDWKALLNRGNSPAEAAENRFEAQRNIYVGKKKPRVDRYQANGRVDVWEDDNEVVPDDPREATWFSEYCIEMMNQYDEIGKKRANFNFATGTPDIRPGHPDDIWPHLLPAIRYARDNGHYLALHEYMGPYADLGVGHRQVDRHRQVKENAWNGRLDLNGNPDESYPYGYCPLRYRMVYDLYLRPEGLADIPLLITECGCDGVDAITPIDMEAGSWTHLRDGYWREAGIDAEPHYASMLQWYDQRICEDDYVLGAMIFTVGSHGGTRWVDFDISGSDVENRILAYISAERARPELAERDKSDALDAAATMSSSAETPALMPAAAAAAVAVDTTGFVTASAGLRLRSGPSTDTETLSILKLGTQVQINSQIDGWYQVSVGDQQGYVWSGYISTTVPAKVPPPVTTPVTSPGAGAAPGSKSGSVIGVHGPPGAAAPPKHLWDRWANYMKEMGVRWYKQCENTDGTGDGSIFQWVLHLKRNEIEPIVRFLVQQQFPNNLEERLFRQMRRYAEQGVRWAEIGNEPNLRYEWKSDWWGRYEGDWPHGHWAEQPRMRWSNPESIAALAKVWVEDATRAADLGAWPAFYAFGPTDVGPHRPNGLYSSTKFTDLVVARLASHHRAQTIELFRNRQAWIAVHVCKYEKDFDYNPYGEDPNRPWDMALRGYEVVLRAFRRHFGQDLNIDQIPIISTEGGVFTPEHKNWGGLNPPRVPANDDEHAQQTVDMFRYVQDHTPLTAMCPWCLAEGSHIIGHGSNDFRHHGWFKEESGQLRERKVYHAMRDLKASLSPAGAQADVVVPAQAGIGKSADDLLPEEAESKKTIVTVNVQIEVQIDGEADDIVVNVKPQVE